MYGVQQGDIFLWDTFTYFNYFSIRDSLWVERLFLSDKKDIHEYLAKVRPISSLRMHDLLEILEHAFSLLGEFFQYTYYYM